MDWQVLGHRHCKLLVLFPVRLPPGGSYCLFKREPYPLCSQWHPGTYLQHRKNDDSKIRLMIKLPPTPLKCLWLSSGREMSCWKLNLVHLCFGGNPVFKINMLVLFEVVCSSKAQLLCLFYAWYSREMQFNLWYKILLKERSFKKKKKKIHCWERKNIALRVHCIFLIVLLMDFACTVSIIHMKNLHSPPRCHPSDTF